MPSKSNSGLLRILLEIIRNAQRVKRRIALPL
jgi:hypothetical protein